MKLSEHINEVMAEFDERKLLQACHCCDCEKQIKSFLEQSLKSIAYKSIDAVRVDEVRTRGNCSPDIKCESCNPLWYGHNSVVRESAQKEKDYKNEN